MIDLHKAIDIYKRCNKADEKSALNYLEEQCKLNTLETVLERINSMERKYYLKKHPYSIFQTPDGRYVTWVVKNGKRVQKRRKELTDLQDWLIAYYKDCEAKEIRDMSLIMKNVYQEWQDYRRDICGVSNKTIQLNDWDWNRFFANSELAEMNVKDITPHHIISHLQKITADEKYTAKAVCNARSVLNGIFDMCIEKEYISRNPMKDASFKRLRYKQTDSASGDVFAAKDIVSLNNFLQDTDDIYGLAIRLMCNLVIRVGELKALTWDDIDFDNKTVHIHSQILEQHITATDSVSLETQLQALLDKYRGNRIDWNYSFKQDSIRLRIHAPYVKAHSLKGCRVEHLNSTSMTILQTIKDKQLDNTYVFVGKDGKFLLTTTLNEALKKYCNQIGVEFKSSHKIRFYAASTMYEGGVPLTQIQQYLGHTTIQMTMHYLRTVIDKEGREMAFNMLDCGIVTKSHQKKCEILSKEKPAKQEVDMLYGQ